MRPCRTACLLGAVSAVLAACPSSANAAVAVASFSLTPSTTQAGSNPNLDIDAQFSSSPPTDTVRRLALSLPPGLFASPAAVPTCAGADFAVDNCSPGSLIGSGSVTATAYTLFGEFTAASPARVYLVAAQGAEVARLGLVVSTPIGRVSSSAPVTIRTAPDVGLDAVFSDLPNQLAGQGIAIRRIQLTLFGTVGSNAFTRNPTSCGPATTSLVVVAYDGTAASGQSAFTPTGCESLPFAPTGTARARLDPTGGGVAIRLAVAQPHGQAAVRRITQTLPPAVAPRLSAFGRTCAEADPAACPASTTVGAAVATTPLLRAPITGRMILRTQPGRPLPRLTIVFPPPLGLHLDGVAELGAGGVSTTFDGIPDVPLSNLEVQLAGGAQSLFTGTALCSGSHALTGALAAHNGAGAPIAAPIAVSGCKPVAPGATATARGLAGRRPRVRLVLRLPANAPPLRAVNVRFPRGLRVSSRGLSSALRVTAGGRRIRGGHRRRGNGLRIELPAPGSRRVTISLGRPALRVSAALVRRVRAGQRPRLSFVVAVRDARGGVVSTRARGRAR